MKKASTVFILGILLLNCCIHPSPKTKQFKTKLSSEVQKELETFIEKDNWQYDGIAKRPVIAATTEEVDRLRAAWNGTGAEHDIVANRFARVDKALGSPVIFPPEGGEHNQWYQCNICQRGLVTIDAHHHKCPQCGRIYSGFPYDNVLYSNQHRKNFSLAEDAAWAWTITGDKKYAGLAAEILLGYASLYLKYPMIDASVSDPNIDVAAGKSGKYRSAGHIMSQTLDEAMLMIPAVTAYDLIYDSGALSPEDKKQIGDNLFRAMAGCINLNKTGKSNWQTWHNAALMYAGVVLGDKQMVKEAILDGDNGFVAQMKISVLPEGMWYENSWGYHYYTLNALTLIAEGGRRLGMDFYSDEMLHKMYMLPIDYRMSDGSLPRFGDAVNDSPDNQSVNEEAYAVYRDPRLLSALPDKLSWEMIMAGRKPGARPQPLQTISKVIPGSGHAILATDGPGKLTAAITFGPYGGFHGHYDKLSFVFFGYGRELAVDPGRAASQAYRLPIHSEWYKATTGHNDILVDGQPQKEAGGSLLAFAFTPSYAAVSADAGPAFDNVSQRRFLLLARDYLLVVDELRTLDGKEHTFDWIYHNKGSNITCRLPGSKDKPGSAPPGYSYLRDINAYEVVKTEPFEVTFPDGELTTRLTMAGQTGDKVFIASGPFSSVDDRVPVTIVRRKGKTVHFIALIGPETRNQQKVTTMSLSPGNTLSIDIIRSGEEDLVSFPEEGIESFSVSTGSASSGRTLVLRTDSVK